MTYLLVVHDLLMTCSLLAHGLLGTYKSPLFLTLFIICSLLIHDLFMTCSSFVYDLFITFFHNKVDLKLFVICWVSDSWTWLVVGENDTVPTVAREYGTNIDWWEQLTYFRKGILSPLEASDTGCLKQIQKHLYSQQNLLHSILSMKTLLVCDLLPSSVPVQYQLSPIWTETCIIITVRPTHPTPPTLPRASIF